MVNSREHLTKQHIRFHVGIRSLVDVRRGALAMISNSAVNCEYLRRHEKADTLGDVLVVRMTTEEMKRSRSSTHKVRSHQSPAEKLRTNHDLGHILVECDLGAITVEGRICQQGLPVSKLAHSCELVAQPFADLTCLHSSV